MQNNFYDALKAAFEHSPIPFAVLDRDMHIVYSNLALLKRYGDLSDPVKLYMLFEGVDKQTIVNYLKSEKNYELICDLPDKKDARIYLSAIFSDDGNGEFIGASATLLDLAENRTDIFSGVDENEYHMSINRELRERINLMLYTVGGLSSIDDIDASPKVCEYINDINRYCYQLLRISDNLAKITRLSAKNDYAVFELTDFNEFMKKFIATVIHIDTERRAPIHFELANQMIPVKLDSRRMEFAIANILLNSMKYTRDGNEIDISLRTVGNNAVLSISDRGAGIPRDVLPFVGTPYFPYSHNGKFEAGFGISLYVAKKYIASHGGNFLIQSVEGQGTTVTISLPIDTGSDNGGNTLTLHSPTPFEPEAKYSQTRIQLSEVCSYPII